MTTAWDRRHHQAAANARARATQLAAQHTRPTPSPANAARTTTAELRQCPRCYGPTDTPEEHCT